MNNTGMAVGSAITQDDKHYILLPGPPREMKPMFEHYAKPWILGKMSNTDALHSRMLKFCGIGESRLEHELDDSDCTHKVIRRSLLMPMKVRLRSA